MTPISLQKLKPKVSVGPGGTEYGITIDGNAKSSQKKKYDSILKYISDMPEAPKEVRKMGGALTDFPGFEVKTIY